MRIRIGIVVATCLVLSGVPAHAMAAPTSTPVAKAAKVTKTHPRVARLVLTSFESRLLLDVNAARASRGLPRLRATPGATSVARRWSARMAKSGVLSHNPSYSSQLSAAGSSNWQWMAENVAYVSADDADAMFTMYMNSKGHRANILNPKARVIGIGVSVSAADWGPVVWNTMDFSDA